MIESWIRTAVPTAVGAALTWLAVRLGVVVDEATSAAVIVAATGVMVACYYAAGRFIERRWPTAGRWLLAAGLVGAPVYRDDRPPVV